VDLQGTRNTEWEQMLDESAERPRRCGAKCPPVAPQNPGEGRAREPWDCSDAGDYARPPRRAQTAGASATFEERRSLRSRASPLCAVRI
jgi:hypothetical protein